MNRTSTVASRLGPRSSASSSTGAVVHPIEVEARTNEPSHLRLVDDVKRQKRGVSPLLWVGALTVAVALFGLAAFHNFMATAQYDLERLELQLEVEQSRLVDLEFEVEQLNSPAKVESLATGVLGMIDPGETVDIVVSPGLLAEVQTAANAQRGSGETSTDWATLKPLLGAS